MAKSVRLELGDNIYGLYKYRSIFNTVASKAIEFGEKRKIRAITPFKVIQGHRSRYQPKPVFDFLLVIIVTDVLSRAI